ncbi:MAG: NAD(P)/FAD-dependent oxidoreductase [Longimicrobiales bacterium]
MKEVVIIGGGPGGLTLGCYLARAGTPCVILERAHHPRPHVGESLMPSAVRIFREIGFHPVMEAAEFPHSDGVVYHPPNGDAIEIAYSEFPQEGVEQSYTYHVDRSKFDLLLMKHAESLGCRIVQGASVKEVAFDEGRAVGVHAAVADQEIFIPGRIVVDAGGRSAKIGHQLHLLRNHPDLDQFALHAWFLGVDRGRSATALYTHVDFLPELRGWAWRAPINDEITSIGVVAAKATYHSSGRSVEDFFAEGLGMNRALAKATRNAIRINDLKGEANYSYALERVCGDGWLAIGDAARFIDPIFSSGVGVAMHGARAAAERIQVALAKGDVSREVFLPYEAHLAASAAIWDEFIGLFYRLLPAFTRVIESPAHRLNVLRLIQGEVLPDAHAHLLKEMREIVLAVEQSEERDPRRRSVTSPRI